MIWHIEIKPWFWLFEVSWIIVVIGWLVSERRSPTSTVTWMVLLIFMPWFGAFLYFFFGPPRMRRRKIAYERIRPRTSLLHQNSEQIKKGLSDKQKALALVAQRTSGSPPLQCEQIQIFTHGSDVYEKLLQTIQQATHHIHLEYYIFRKGKSALQIRDALVERAKAGVEVRLLIDYVGSHQIKASFFKPITQAGGKVVSFTHTAFARFRPYFSNFRTHRKIVVVDGTIGMLGGMNIDDIHDERLSGKKAWRDTHIWLEGDAVKSLQATFAQNWRYAANEILRDQDYFPYPTMEGNHLVQIVPSGPDGVYSIHKLFIAAIGSAEKRIWITTPYFVPDEALLEALTVAALRGVDVSILIPQKSDNPIIDAASRTFFEELILVGVKIHQYQPRMLHAKTLVVDNTIATVGTANFDSRSFRLNFEVLATFYDAFIINQLAEIFQNDLNDSVVTQPLQPSVQNFLRRWTDACVRLFAPFL